MNSKPHNLVDGHVSTKLHDVVTYMTVTLGDDMWGLFLNFCHLFHILSKIHVPFFSMSFEIRRHFVALLRLNYVELLFSSTQDVRKDSDYFCFEN